MLVENGYDPNPQLISGRNGMQMVVYRPAEGRTDVRPVVSFRGTEGEMGDIRTDFNPEQVGNEQYAANDRLINSTMQKLGEQYGDQGGVEVTGHSLGGALAQIAAARNPDATNRITTFQAAGVAREEVERIEAHNREREAQGLPPLEADHFRVDNDIVPLAGDGFAPGQIHQMHVETARSRALDSLSPAPLFGPDGINPVAAHTSHPVTAAALETEQGRRALPGIARPEEDVVDMRSSAVDNPDWRATEEIRSGIGMAGRGARVIGDAHMRNANRAVDAHQRSLGSTVRVGQQGVDRAQETTQATVDIGQHAVDRGQGAVQSAVAQGQRQVDVLQHRALGDHRGVARVHEAIDAGQRGVGAVVDSGAVAIDSGQRAVDAALASGHRAADRGQRAVSRAVSAGQRGIDDAQQHVRDAWDWITD